MLDNQQENLPDKQKFPSQPNQFQIQFVKDRGDLITCKMDETRTVPKRSMLILLTKNSVLQMEQSYLLKQEIQARASEDSKSLNVEQTHERTEPLVATLNTADARDSSQMLSLHESDTFNVEGGEILKKMENPLLFMT